MSDFTFLEESQIFGPDRLDIIEKHGTKCVITDFSILLGGHVSSFQFVTEMATLKDRTGKWWTKTKYVGYNGIKFEPGNTLDTFGIGARPVLITPNEVFFPSSSSKQYNNGLIEVNYGEYPQTVAPYNISSQLEEEYSKGRLSLTRKTYTTGFKDIKPDDYIVFRTRSHAEYKWNGKKYIRIVPDFGNFNIALSDGRIAKTGQAYWVEVEPITWLVDEIKGIALAKKILFSGVPFDNTSNYTGDFENTLIYKFMNTHFSKDIIPSKITSLEQSQTLVQQSKPIRSEDYQIHVDQYNSKKEELVTFQLQLADIQDNRTKLITERKIEEENIERIKRKIETHETNDIQRQLDNYKTEIQKLDTKKQKITHKIGQLIDYKVDKEVIFTWLCLSALVIGTAMIALILSPLLVLIEIGITEYILAPIERLSRRIKKRKIKSLSQKEQMQNQKMLETAKTLQLILENNPEAINQLNELKNELNQTIGRINSIDHNIQQCEIEANKCQSQINSIKQEIDRLFYTLTAIETELLLNGEEVESVLNEESIVKKLGEYPKGGN
ncbi:MAG: hypothetical protein HFH46_02210 [Bacilli bacterium]|nr:hypothetical protein [Bacilli bacterium]